MTNKIFIFLFFLCLIFPINIVAQSFTSPSYQIQWGNFNMTGGKKTSATFILTDSVGQNTPGKFTNTGFVIKSGFQYAYDLYQPFSFKIDNLDLDFGHLVPQVGSTQTNIITITTPSSHGYDILSSENHPLLTSNFSTTIPDTTCDNGTCNQSTSAVWTDSTKYGFGFNAIGINSSGVVTDIGTSNFFIDDTYYRQFANLQASETPQVFMSETKPVKDHSAKITYKINISPYQSSGFYQNSINFIAIPKY
ncbi:MAG: hypothetical protein WC895_02435 [Candidatus Shapirobacteria bacterium]|jgi:hypothetical protein